MASRTDSAQGPSATAAEPSELEHGWAYRTAGVLLLSYGLIPVLFGFADLIAKKSAIDTYLERLVNPVAAGDYLAAAPYDWALTAALIVVGICTLLRRETARGAALLLAIGLLFASVREAVGLLDADYRAGMWVLTDSGWTPFTRLFGFAIAVVVIGVLAPVAGPRKRPRTPGFVIAGTVLVAAGVLQVARITYIGATYGDLDGFVSGVLDAAAVERLSTASETTYPFAVSIIGTLIVGGLALARYEVARGATFALMGMSLYTSGYLLAGVLTFGFADLGSWLASALLWASLLAPLVAGLVAIPAMILAAGRARPRRDRSAP